MAKSIDIEKALKALANDKRLLVMALLKDPLGNFLPQVDGDLVEDGVCSNWLTEKMGVAQPTASRHLQVLADAGLIIPTRKKGWVFYRRDEAFICALKKKISEDM
ncbi:ArsR/SmtB family transcription factor [Kordiimonas lacus]|uniref:ArsR family transcriptional regulator n=1 Tax=Kordiimonas lacus TaxID=637679 RepID=A0A1G7AWF1_9PROT|nr:metalloregulator ArsR/SmtB family transcription factor [Kordiimonas lacus]SDE19198.1 ArsR family transcriptional regulator [Kordiimonas lacus]